MGLMDEIRKLTHPYDKEDDGYDDYDEEEFEEEPAPAPRRSYTTRAAAAAAAPEAPRQSAGRVMNINSASNMQVVLVKPDRFDQVSEIADRLRDRQSVVLNLESTNKDVARRLVDFLSGCAYALDGKIRKVAISTYLVTPYNVDVVGETVDEAESTASYF